MSYVYKGVVDLDDGIFYSVCHVFVWGLDNSVNVGQKISLEYHLGQITKPRIENSALYAFKTVKHALDFVRYGMGGLEIWRYSFPILECKYAPSVLQPYVARFPRTLTSITDFWKSMFGKKDYINTNKLAPTGTVMCNWIKPVKIIGRVYINKNYTTKFVEATKN